MASVFYFSISTHPIATPRSFLEHKAVFQRAPVQITLTNEDTSTPLSSDFTGLSIETSTICTLLDIEQRVPQIDRMFKNLGHGVMRMGGASVENAVWSPTGRQSCSWAHTVITKATINAVFSFARRVGWRVIWGENFQYSDPATFADEAAYVVSAGKSDLLALEIGNEPDLYGWDYNTFRTKWEAFAHETKKRVPTASLSGPGTCCKDQWFANFMHDDAMSIDISTPHIYATDQGGSGPFAPTIENLLSSSLMQRLIARFDFSVKAAGATRNHPPVDIAEANSIGDVPSEAVGNSFAQTLWTADYMFSAAEHGVTRLNFHGGFPPDATSPLNNNGSPRALYYGMLFFHATEGPGKARILPILSTQLNTAKPLNITAYAILGSDGKLRIALINKEQTSGTSADINLNHTYRKVSIMRLTAPSVPSTSGMTLGGVPISSSGTWTPRSSEAVTMNDTTATLSLPAGSAAIVTCEN